MPVKEIFQTMLGMIIIYVIAIAVLWGGIHVMGFLARGI